jgi:hypothetical protein
MNRNQKHNRTERSKVIKTIIGMGAGALIAAGSLVLATPAAPAHASCINADDAQGGGGGGWPGGGGYVDCHFAPDGSHEHCVNVHVLGYGGWNCGRVGPA